MFGFNLKDENGDLFYKEVSWEELESLVEQMKAKAKADPPFDFLKACKTAQADETVDKEMVGPMLRIHGPDATSACKEYNKYIRLGLHALQLCYYEMDVPQMGRVGQLTIVDNYKLPLEKELVLGFVDMFFDYKAMNWRPMETPAHVAVVVEPCK
jgi:hypothetical protein